MNYGFTLCVGKQTKELTSLLVDTAFKLVHLHFIILSFNALLDNIYNPIVFQVKKTFPTRSIIAGIYFY